MQRRAPDGRASGNPGPILAARPEVEHPLEVPLLELRARLEASGVRFAFGTRLEGLLAGAGPTRRVRALATSQGELDCDAVLLAPGHSARDTWHALERHGVALEAKPFQLGVRIDHPQELIDAGRYGYEIASRLLSPAYYALSCRRGNGLSPAHSFCMCPEGQIVAAVIPPGLLCTNGWSNSRHSSGRGSLRSCLLADETTREAVLIDSVREQVDRDAELIAQLGLRLALMTHR